MMTEATATDAQVRFVSLDTYFAEFELIERSIASSGIRSIFCCLS